MPFSRGGFTLLEVVVALAIAVMLVVVGTAALRAYMQTYSRQMASIDEALRDTLFAVLFFRQLQNIPDRPFGRSPVFTGEGDSLKFVSLVKMTGSGFPGIYGVEFRIEDNLLLERDTPLVDAEDYDDFLKSGPKEEGDWYVVFSVPEGELSFAYRGTAGWQTSWRSGFPRFVALKSRERYIFIFPVRFF